MAHGNASPNAILLFHHIAEIFSIVKE